MPLKTLTLMIAAGICCGASAKPLASFTGQLTDKLPGWSFKPSKPKGGMTYNKFEGYYPDKGGKLISPPIKLDKKAGEPAYYRIKFEAKAPERAYQGVDFYDAKKKLLPDCYDVVYSGEKRSYDRIVYAMSKVDHIRVFFQSKTGIEAWNLVVEPATAEEAADYCDKLYATLPPLDFKTSADALKMLPKTAAALKNGQPWRVVMLGDSIMQDTFHSQFHSLLKREFPKSNFDFVISMRGGTGCWYYCMADKFKEYVVDEKPDLLVIGGISNNRSGCMPTGPEAIEVVVKAMKSHFPDSEILILSPSLAVDTRTYDKENPEAPLPVQPWCRSNNERIENERLLAMARRNNVPVWDMQTGPYTWLYTSGKPHEWYSRDFVHSGERGKQIIGRTLMEYFKTAK